MNGRLMEADRLSLGPLVGDEKWEELGINPSDFLDTATPQRQEYVHRPTRQRRKLNKFACQKCQTKKTKVLYLTHLFSISRTPALTEIQLAVRRCSPALRRLRQAP